ncbi:hypothetical protein FD13_GL001259 [Levilactobacillus senmaizukei DSM 21775 = NBRC 103853]|uniref:MucBP domain-containing protein n=1 Tax=Levilactobacillus senmaizukei DSM 21775 = NBRC 103853 TaxID=1423803 RepID=A0A0R2DFU7_9LACO|nr:DUF5776 domain-containing protein [Levilactobacillus senmaizukei]KRN02943.1 hypothetical protein FD13_GL001259 [Levilactobacillus senmaizukei DSM 21775 = NBRC 103853]
MSKLVRRLVLAGLTLSLLGGIVTPTLAQAATTTPATTDTTEPQDSVNYQFASIQAPYNRITDEQGQTTKVPWYPGTSTNPFPQSYASSDVKVELSLPFVKYDDPETSTPRFIARGMLSLAKDGVSVDPDESLAEYLAPRNGYSSSFSPDDLTTYFTNYSYVYSWLYKVAAQTKLGTRSYSDIKKDLNGNVMEKLAEMEDIYSAIPMTEGMSNYLGKTAADFKVTASQILKSESMIFLTDSTERLARLDPQASADKERDLLKQPVKSFIIPQKDSSDPERTTYIADGQLSTIASPNCFVFKAATPATMPSATSHPVTVHYVDDQGKTLKPDKTLTGSLGDSYNAEPLNIAGYKLVKTTGDESGKFTSAKQAVTYTYRKVAADVAVKNSVVYATKKIGLYRSPTFSKKALKTMYAKKSRMNRPTFKVIGTATSKNGVKRYKVKDLNGKGTTGYITANAGYVAPLYYANQPTKVTVINPKGLNAYSKKNLTHKRSHYQQGQVLRVKKIVNHNLTTRLQLSNGKYVSANKKLVIAGKYTMPKHVRAKTGINRYGTANLTKRNKHFAKGKTLKVTGWAYSNAHNFRKGDTLRYRVSGGYITGNKRFVSPFK